MKAGFSKLLKHNFTNWFVTKTGTIKGKEQVKIKSSMNELFMQFDVNNTKDVE